MDAALCRLWESTEPSAHVRCPISVRGTLNARDSIIVSSNATGVPSFFYSDLLLPHYIISDTLSLLTFDMDKKILNALKIRLLDEQKQLETELSQFARRNTKATTTDFDTNFPKYGDDEDENASEVAQYLNNLSLENELEKALRDVLSSLERIEKGTYGTCKYCKAEIQAARLQARPTSTSCIACKKTLTQEM